MIYTVKTYVKAQCAIAVLNSKMPNTIFSDADCTVRKPISTILSYKFWIMTNVYELMSYDICFMNYI